MSVATKAPDDAVSLEIDASPEKLWEMVSDITNMGRWSPETYRTRWLDGAARAAPGARFKGYNRWRGIRWATTVEVEVAQPGREFTFFTIVGGKRRTTWRYVFEPNGGTTTVTETRTGHSTEFFRGTFQRYFMRGHVESFKDGMRTTLARIKAAAEKG